MQSSVLLSDKARAAYDLLDGAHQDAVLAALDAGLDAVAARASPFEHAGRTYLEVALLPDVKIVFRALSPHEDGREGYLIAVLVRERQP